MPQHPPLICSVSATRRRQPSWLERGPAFLAGQRLFGLDDLVGLGRGIRELFGLFDDLVLLSLGLVLDRDEAGRGRRACRWCRRP